MADVMRYRYGETNPVMCAVDSAQVIEIGDLLYLATDDVRPASQQTDQGSEASNQLVFADNFMGVAMQRSRSGDTDPIRVATTGVFEFACDSATWEIGALAGADEAASGTALNDQYVKAASSYAHAIGRCARRQATAVTSVLIDITSTVMRGGVAGTSGA